MHTVYFDPGKAQTRIYATSDGKLYSHHLFRIGKGPTVENQSARSLVSR